VTCKPAQRHLAERAGHKELEVRSEVLCLHMGRKYKASSRLTGRFILVQKWNRPTDGQRPATMRLPEQVTNGPYATCFELSASIKC
jgi:hypothetical protein